jgi:pilus assembly protein Flp/PilA
MMLKSMIAINIAAQNAKDSLLRLRRDESGATAVEYALIVGLIAIVIIAAVTALGGGISTLFSHAACVVKGGTWTSASNTCSI